MEESSPPAGGHQNGQDLPPPVPPSAYVHNDNHSSSNNDNNSSNTTNTTNTTSNNNRKQIRFDLKNFLGLIVPAVIIAVVFAIVRNDGGGDDKDDNTPGGSFDPQPTVSNEVDSLESVGDFELLGATDESMGYYHQVAISANGFIVVASRGRMVQFFRRTSTGQYQEEKVLFPPITILDRD